MKPAEAVWSSLRWSDGSIYEGLTTPDGHLHWSGVMQYANGDRYEGEFSMGEMHGYGAYIWKDGTVYRGEWHHGLMHGCGAALHRQPKPSSQQPSAQAATSGEASRSQPQAASQQELEVRHGKWFVDHFSGPIMSCSTQAASDAAVEADVAAHMARAFVTPHGMRHRQQSRQNTQNSGLQLKLGAHQHQQESSLQGTSQQQGAAAMQQRPSHAQQHQHSQPAPWFAGLSWPWQKQQSPASPSNGPSVQAGGGSPLDSNDSASVKQAPGINLVNGTSTSSRLLRPPGDYGGDGDVRLRTRLLSDAEQTRVKGLVDKLMQKALQEAQGQGGAK